MYIIHYIHHIINDHLLADYVTMLAEGQAGYAEIKVMTHKDGIAAMLGKKTPDIVHIHSCWDYKASRVADYARKKGVAVVFSPHRQLNQLYRRKEHPIAKSFRTIAYQRRMTIHADALLVCSDRERDELLRLGWQKRIGIVKNSLLCNSFSTEEMSLESLQFYHKVIDTRYRLSISRQEYDCISYLLSLSLSDEITNYLPSTEKLKSLQTLTEAQWKRILLYADDEDIRPYLQDAAKSLDMKIPPIDSKNILRFSPSRPKQNGLLEKKEWLNNSAFAKQWTEELDETSSAILRNIATMLANSKFLIRKRRFSMRHLCELYIAIKYQEYDEDQLKCILKELHLYRFSRRIIQIMAKWLHLEEGFIPLSPLDDIGTVKLERAIL